MERILALISGSSLCDAICGYDYVAGIGASHNSRDCRPTEYLMQRTISATGRCFFMTFHQSFWCESNVVPHIV